MTTERRRPGVAHGAGGLLAGVAGDGGDRARPDAPGGLVVVVRDGAVVYEEAFGVADLSTMRPYTLDTPTNIGSTSKQFTAFAIVTLAEQGLLSLDDDVREHLPELPVFKLPVFRPTDSTVQLFS